MSYNWPLFIYGLAVFTFGWQILLLLPTTFRLLRALSAGSVRWPGPRIHFPVTAASAARGGPLVGYQNLYASFFRDLIILMAAFAFWLLNFLSYTQPLHGLIAVKSPLVVFCLNVALLVASIFALRQARRGQEKVDIILQDLAAGGEPRAIDGHTAESDYAIEHPLLGRKSLNAQTKKALDQFALSARFNQEGYKARAVPLYQAALKTDPSLHQNALEQLSLLAGESPPAQAGPIYYWSAIHSEYLLDYPGAAAHYQKALQAYEQLGYSYPMSRVHCNLASTKMRLGDPSAMDDYHQAIALNPRNGTAYINIARAYYRVSYPGDPEFDLALDAFAGAIIADPPTYGPIVVSDLRGIGYEWQKDLEEITRRVESKRQGGEEPPLLSK